MSRVRSPEPGAYSWTGSLAGKGTSVMASMQQGCPERRRATHGRSDKALKPSIVESDKGVRGGGADDRARARAAVAGPGPHDGDAGRGAARPGHAGRIGGAGRCRRRAARPGGRPGIRRPVLPARRVRRRGGALDRAAGRDTGRVPAAIFVKEPSQEAIRRAVALGTAVVSVEPRARWELLYKLVNHAFEHHGDRGDPFYDSGTDLFGLAQSIADRTHGMISIEDEDSHVLAYSASSDEADELRRLTILGPRRPARTPGVDRPVGHLRRAARQRRGRPGRRTPRAGPATAAGRRHPSAADGCAPQARLRRNDLAAAGIGAAGRRCRGHPARRCGARGTGHVAAGGRAVDAHRAGAGAARPHRRGGRRGRGRPRARHHR